MSETSILRKGTRCWRVYPDGTISSELVLDCDLEVTFVEGSTTGANVWDDQEGGQLLTNHEYEVR